MDTPFPTTQWFSSSFFLAFLSWALPLHPSFLTLFHYLPFLFHNLDTFRSSKRRLARGRSQRKRGESDRGKRKDQWVLISFFFRERMADTFEPLHIEFRGDCNLQEPLMGWDALQKREEGLRVGARPARSVGCFTPMQSRRLSSYMGVGKIPQRLWRIHWI